MYFPVKSLKHFLILSICTISFTLNNIVQAQNPQNNSSKTNNDFQKITAQSVNDTNSFYLTEKLLVEQLHTFKSELKKELKEQQLNQWLTPVSIVGIVTLILSLLQLVINKQLKNWEILIESLKWFEGGTQERNIGISIIESHWDRCQHNKQIKNQWTLLLINQAIYLLTRQPTKEKEENPVFHEEQNLIRIMDILHDKVLKGQQVSQKINTKDFLFETHFRFLSDAIKDHVKNPKQKKLKDLNKRIIKVKDIINNNQKSNKKSREFIRALVIYDSDDIEGKEFNDLLENFFEPDQSEKLKKEWDKRLS